MSTRSPRRAASRQSSKSLSTKSSIPHIECPEQRPPTPGSNPPTPEPIPPRLWPNISNSRFWIITVSLWISLFISTIDTTIVTTALLPISADLTSSLSPTWILVVYLLTYTSFLLVSTSLSDIFGMKIVLLCCNIAFLLASLACSLARNMIQLIIFRALQGATASGLYNLPFVVVLKVVEPERVSKFTTIIGGIFTMANLLGPILGGWLATTGKWRVMFAMNIPLSTLAFVLLFIAGPEEPGPIINLTRLRRMDWLGGLLSIGWAAPLVLALQEGGDMWQWDSTIMKCLLIFGALGLVVFIAYEIFVVKYKVDPVLPCSIFRTAPVFWLMCNALLIGVTFYGAITLLPFRFQIVQGMSASKAGLVLLLMTMTVPVGALTGAELSHRYVYGAEWVALAGSIMVLIGTVLLGFLPGGAEIPLTSWFAQVHLGIGFGLLGAIALFIQKDHIAYEQIASSIGIYDMVRAMGGTIGVAICSAINHANLECVLRDVLPESKVGPLLEDFSSVQFLSVEEQRHTRDAYSRVFSYQFYALASIAGINVVTSMIMIWSRYFRVKKWFSKERRGDAKYQAWREREVGRKGKDQERSPPPIVPSMDGFENISLRDM